MEISVKINPAYVPEKKNKIILLNIRKNPSNFFRKGI